MNDPNARIDPLTGAERQVHPATQRVSVSIVNGKLDVIIGDGGYDENAVKVEFGS